LKKAVSGEIEIRRYQILHWRVQTSRIKATYTKFLVSLQKLDNGFFIDKLVSLAAATEY
jgi:hypothetical protein